MEAGVRVYATHINNRLRGGQERYIQRCQLIATTRGSGNNYLPVTLATQFSLLHLAVYRSVGDIKPCVKYFFFSCAELGQVCKSNFSGTIVYAYWFLIILIFFLMNEVLRNTGKYRYDPGHSLEQLSNQLINLYILKWVYIALNWIGFSLNWQCCSGGHKLTFWR